jgi:hypothetical protein
MEGNHCRLFDENLVRNIMVSTGLSIQEYIRDHKNPSEADVCEFVELNADAIIWNTIEDMNSTPGSKDFPDEEDLSDLNEDLGNN